MGLKNMVGSEKYHSRWMVQAYDHRAASVKIEAGNWMRQGQTEETTQVEHPNPEFVVQPRWWVDEVSVLQVVTP